MLKKAVVLGDEDRLDGLLEKIMKEERIACSGSTPNPYTADSTLSLKNRLLKLEREILAETIREEKTSRKIAKSLGISQTSVMRKIKNHGLSL